MSLLHKTVAPACGIKRTQARSALRRGHNVLHGESAAAVAKTRTALDELPGWRARYQPFVAVWSDFAQAFRGVTNQIGEAGDVVNTAAHDERTDDALTDMQAIKTGCAAWRVKHAGMGVAWAGLDEQAGFMMEAIGEATRVFGSQGVRERACLRCGKPFLSRDAGNRLCERFASKYQACQGRYGTAPIPKFYSGRTSTRASRRRRCSYDRARR